MASTIQLKTGTGSAVPSSLTQGEVAINIDNGLVYYGSGSTNTTKQLESFTHITASGDISASGTGSFSDGRFTGNVGIGTTSPQKKLDVSGGDIRLDNSRGIFFASTDANIGRVSITGDEGSDFIMLKVDNNNSHVLNLNTTGVGIGTTSPGEKLEVVGNISASGELSAATVSDVLAAAVVTQIDNDEIPIAKLAEDAVTVTAGTNLSNGGTVTLGGSITLNVDDAFLKNDADDTTSGTITSAGLIATKATDGGDTVIQIINSNTDGGTDKGTGIEFKHGSALGALSGNQRAGKILATKVSSYQGTTAAIDSNLEFYTANNDTDTLQLKIDNTGLAAFTGDVSSSGKFITSEISASTAVSGLTITGNITASGNISASGNIYGRQFEQIETNFAENLGTRGVVYMPFSNQSISDNANSSNINVNRVAVVPGKPVKSVIRAVSNTLGDNAQYTMSYWEAAAGDPTTPILKSAAYAITDASSNKDAIIFDFTDPGSGSTTDVAVGSRIWMTLEAEGTGNGSFIVTHLWEWDYNSI